MGSLNVAEWIEARPISTWQLWVFFLCGLTAIMDGIDLNALAYAAPVVVRTMHVAPAALAPALSASLFGLMVGALIGSPLADRIGRKMVVVLSVLSFGVFSLFVATATSVPQLVLWRFLSGLGLGGSMPNVIAMANEYAPRRAQKAAVSIMFIGVPLGGSLAALIAAHLLPARGWPPLFIDVLGLPAIGVAVVDFLWLPESIRYLVVQQKPAPQILQILRRIDSRAALDPETRFFLPEATSRAFPVSRLFVGANARNTPLLWVMFFMNLAIVYFLGNWLPTILHASGLSLATAIYASQMETAGGVLGGLVMGAWLLQRMTNQKRLVVGIFSATTLSLLLLGLLPKSPAALFVLLFVNGFFVLGTQFVINALAAALYVTAARSTGVGWALGWGRLGSILSPLVGGILVADHAGLPTVFGVAAVSALLGGVAGVLLRARSGGALGADEEPGAGMEPVANAP
ncbi:MAG: MFS transporter [Firmicutes bacterium]|nr:MFS transporter [Alicyclobacillaceae bacterium]MCL6496149.1 MFS transporter [Bacillota bacterium]